MIGVLVAGVLYSQPSILQLGGEDVPADGTNGEEEDQEEEFVEAENETGTSEGAEDAPLAETIEIGAFGVTPARAEGNTGDAFEWENTNDFPVYLTFDRTDDEPTIQADNTMRMRFTGITYYQVYNADTDERIAQGNIYVQ